MTQATGGAFTLTVLDDGRAAQLPALRVTVSPPEAAAPVEAPLGVRPLLVGTGPDCDLRLVDPRVSRRHCELRLTERGVWLRDLGSKNGVLLGEVPVVEAFLPPLVPVRLGGSTLVVTPEGDARVLPLSGRGSFGDAVGKSVPMRAMFALLERAAPTDETVLLLGESGTGKEVLARAVHAGSRRKNGPFAVVDCGALTPTLIESELFGHVSGAATGLRSDREGLLEQANGGTVLIDEIGELPLDLQPRLLRAIESRELRRVGSNKVRPFDARIIAATHRNLRQRAQEGSFRADLYFRLSVMEVHVPALRERKEDIPLLVERFLAARVPPASLSDLPPHALALLLSHDWPGNVRELRNTVSRLLLFPEMLPPSLSGIAPRAAPASPAPPESPSPAADSPPATSDRPSRPFEGDAPPSDSPTASPDSPTASPDGAAALLDLPLAAAREVVLEQFERRYAEERLRRCGGNVSRAAESMGVSRQLLYRLLERCGLRAR